MGDVHFQYLQLTNPHDLVVQLVEVALILAQHLLVRLVQRVLIVYHALLQVVQRERPVVVQEQRPALALDRLQPFEYHEAEHPIQTVQSGCSERFL